MINFFDKFANDENCCVIEASLAPNQFIIIASTKMMAILGGGTNPFLTKLACSTDSLEGWIEPVWFKGQMNVTITSTWCPIHQTQVVVLITILANKTAESHKIHFLFLFEHCGNTRETIEAFFNEFPGNTCDTSDALRKGFHMAIAEYCEKKCGDRVKIHKNFY